MPSPDPIEFRRVRDMGEVINVTFAFLQQNGLAMGKSLLFIAGPLVALLLLSLGLLPFNIFLFGLDPDFDPAAFEQMFTGIGLPVLAIMVMGLLVTVTPYLVVNSYLLLYQDYGPGGFDPLNDVWTVVREDFFKILGTMLALAFLLVLPIFIVLLPCLGVLVYMVGGIYVAVTCSIIFILRMREDIGLIDAFQRCFYLVKGHWFSTFAVVFLTSIIAAILGTVFSLPGTILAFASGLGGEGDGGMVTTIVVGFSVLGMFASVLLQAIPVTAVAFQYFSLVERKEQAGLHDRIDQIGDDA